MLVLTYIPPIDIYHIMYRIKMKSIDQELSPVLIRGQQDAPGRVIPAG